MRIQAYFNWPSVVGKSVTSVLIVTERRLFFSNNAKPAQLESLSDHSDDRAIMQALPKNYKSVPLSKIDRVRLLEGSTHSIGVVGVSAIVIAGVLGGAIWMYLRMKRPLRVFLATRVSTA